MTQQTSASDRKQVRAAEKTAKRIEQDRVDGLRHLVSTRVGRLWLWDHMAQANIFSQSFTGDALISAFNEGRRSTASRCLDDLMAHFPETFIQMMREANDRRTTADSIAERARSAGLDGYPTGPAAGQRTDEPSSAGASEADGTQGDFAFPDTAD